MTVDMTEESGRPGGLSSLRDGAANASPPKASIPDALAEQACCISMKGNEVRIDCDNRDDAEQLFDWLTEMVGVPFNFDAEIAKERVLLDALTAAYEAKVLPYLTFSPAWDVGAARIEALIHAQAIEARQRQDAETGLARKGESAVGNADAPKTPPSIKP